MTINMVLRFLLEICALVALGFWGFQLGKGLILKIALSIGVPLIVAIIWGMFGSPHAPMAVSGTAKLILELLIFGLAVIAIYTSGYTKLSIFFAIVVVVNMSILHIWG